MALIRFASDRDVHLISRLANKIWPLAYHQILSSAQIELMLSDMYSHNSLKVQFDAGIKFLIADVDQTSTGFASFSLSDSDRDVYKIHKLYILPAFQGMKVGSQLIDFIEDYVALKQGKVLEVNVNRNNTAVNFYLKCGFKIIESVDIPYHQFVLNDYIMRKAL